jgi:hypothetical protein
MLDGWLAFTWSSYSWLTQMGSSGTMIINQQQYPYQEEP